MMHLIMRGRQYYSNILIKQPIWYAVEEEFEFMIEYYLGMIYYHHSHLEKGILTPELIERIKQDIEKDSD